ALGPGAVGGRRPGRRASWRPRGTRLRDQLRVRSHDDGRVRGARRARRGGRAAARRGRLGRRGTGETVDRATDFTWQTLSIVAGLLCWEGAVRFGVVDPLFVPAPSAVLSVLAATVPETLPRLGDTLLKTLLGYALAVCVGVPAGLVLGSRPTAHAVAMPY